MVASVRALAPSGGLLVGGMRCVSFVMGGLWALCSSAVAGSSSALCTHVQTDKCSQPLGGCLAVEFLGHVITLEPSSERPDLPWPLQAASPSPWLWPPLSSWLSGPGGTPYTRIPSPLSPGLSSSQISRWAYTPSKCRAVLVREGMSLLASQRVRPVHVCMCVCVSSRLYACAHVCVHTHFIFFAV